MKNDLFFISNGIFIKINLKTKESINFMKWAYLPVKSVIFVKKQDYL